MILRLQRGRGADEALQLAGHLQQVLFHFHIHRDGSLESPGAPTAHRFVVAGAKRGRNACGGGRLGRHPPLHENSHDAVEHLVQKHLSLSRFLGIFVIRAVVVVVIVSDNAAACRADLCPGPQDASQQSHGDTLFETGRALNLQGVVSRALTGRGGARGTRQDNFRGHGGVRIPRLPPDPAVHGPENRRRHAHRSSEHGGTGVGLYQGRSERLHDIQHQQRALVVTEVPRGFDRRRRGALCATTRATCSR